MRGLPLLLLAAALALGWNLNGYRLLDPDEGRNAEVAREMAESNDYLIPRLDGLPYLDKPIVYFASAAVLPGEKVAETSAYVAAKSGVVALARSIAGEEKASGVRANALAPTAIRTATNLASMGEDVRYVEREEVAAAVLFLCSEGGRAVNGQVIRLG